MPLCDNLKKIYNQMLILFIFALVCCLDTEIFKWPMLDATSPTKLHRPNQLYSWNKAAYAKLHPAGSYLACTTQLHPRILWIYHLYSARIIAVLIHENPVLGAYLYASYSYNV